MDSDSDAVRVAIVDDDVWVRTGRAAALSGTAGLRVAAVLDHFQAVSSPDVWEGVDVALVDAYDPNGGFDRYPGAGVVKAIRRHERGPEIAVVVITGHVANDMLRLRMAEAGADLFFGHEEVSNPERLERAVTDAAERRGRHKRGGPVPPVIDQSGGPQPDAAVEWVRAHHAEAAFAEGSQKGLPFSRRAIMGMRRHLGAMVGVPANGGGSPTWRQVRRFVDRARGADLGPDR